MDTSKASAQGAGRPGEQTEKQKETMRNIYKVFENGNYNELDNLISNDIVEHSPDPLIKGTGLNYVKDLFKAYKEAFPDLKVKVNDILAEDNKVASHVTITGTNKGAIMGKPATDKQINVEGIDIVRFKNGKVSDHWGVWDNLKMMSQLGFVPDISQNK